MTPTAGLRPDLPYRRIALVLSGGGALGAYEVGVLRVLEALRLVPSVIVGVSIGAVNAVSWVVSGYDAGPIETVWRTARGEAVGVQWASLALRVTGALTTVIALLQLLLTALVSRELVFARGLWGGSSEEADRLAVRLDLALWIVIALVGVLVVLFARRVAVDVERTSSEVDPGRLRRQLRTALLVTGAAYALVWAVGWPWPLRFHAALVLMLSLAWLASMPGRAGRWLRRITLGLMPETGGRGLWSGFGRRKILERIVAAGDPRRICGPGTNLVVSALAIDTGRIGHFTSWPDPEPGFVARIAEEGGEVIPLATPADLVQAAVASSALAGIFQPERVVGRDFVDAGGFSNQPLHVAIAHGADAVLAVLLSPGEPAEAGPPPADVVALLGRMLELSNWRGLQTELRHLPKGWEPHHRPARVCVVEPPEPLPASPLVFDPARAAELIALGRRHAWDALRRAGWVTGAG